MPRKNKILIRTGTGAPAASDFATSEPAWDSYYGKFYVKDSSGVMVEVGGSGSLAAHASTHAAAGSDAVTIQTSQISDLAAGANAAVRMYLWQTFR